MMTTTDQSVGWSPTAKAILGGLLLAQFLAAFVIGYWQLLASTEPGLIRPIALTAIAPVALFLTAYRLVPRFRAFVLAQDIRTLTMIQHWRVIGFCFLPLYALGALPGLFALPAGLGDVAIGIAALFVIARFDRDPDFATSGALVRFHLLGLLDFAVAVTAAGLASGEYPALIPGGVTSGAMEVWPLNMFPSFGVPAFIIIHLAVLLKVAHLRRQARETIAGAVPAV
jgi:hypothetical protein